MKNTLIALALAVSALASPAYALTINQAIDQFGQGGCTVGANGNQCSQKPVITPGSSHLTTPSTGPSPTYCDGRLGYWDVTSFKLGEHWTCYAAINPHNSAGSLVIDSAATCSITTRTIDHQGRDFNSGWTVTSSKSSC